MTEIFQVPANLVYPAYADIAPLIAGPIDMTEGRHTLATTLDRLEDGKMTAFVALKGAKPVMACIVQIALYPAQKWLQVPFVGGSGMKDWLPALVATLDEFAYNEQCIGVECFGRGGWRRVLRPYGYEPSAFNNSLLCKRLIPNVGRAAA